MRIVSTRDLYNVIDILLNMLDNKWVGQNEVFCELMKEDIDIYIVAEVLGLSREQLIDLLVENEPEDYGMSFDEAERVLVEELGFEFEE